jgi:DNA-binding XRE family transcriptional regulator
MSDYADWKDVKAKARDADRRIAAERAAGKDVARERGESYIRVHQLAEMRRAAGVTQAGLAELLNVSRARISKIESGEISGIDVIRAYVASLGGTVDLVATLGDRTLEGRLTPVRFWAGETG